MTFIETLRLKSSWKSGEANALSAGVFAKNGHGSHAIPGYLPAILGILLQATVGNADAVAGHPTGKQTASMAPAEWYRTQLGAHSYGTARQSNWQAHSDGSGIPDFDASGLERTVWWQIGTERGIDPNLLYAVALTESARVSHETAAPWPWALNRNGRAIYPEGPEAAVAHVRSAFASGNPMIDVGLMQVNLRWHGRRVNRPEDLIDPVTNLRVGAEILAEAIASAPGDLALGVGRYHSWKDQGAAYRYGRKVLALAELIKTSQAW